MSSRYTAEEMREMASVVSEDAYVNYDGGAAYISTSKFDENTIAAMLRQAADMMDREGESDVIQCRKCQTERSGEGYGDVPPPIGEDDICDRCKIAEHLRHNREAENQIERGKKYEFALRTPTGWIDEEATQNTLEDIKLFCEDGNTILRREVGEWEEVPNEE